MNNTGGPAFPHQSSDAIRAGMTLRDYFATAAMQSALVGGLHQDFYVATARRAYHMADAMLAAREN